MRKLFIASFVAASALIISFSFISKTPQKESAGIKWITLQEAEKLNKQKPKKIMVDLFTSWCGWCKQLDATTFQDAKVIEYVNQNFYAVKFNAERPDTIVFNKDKSLLKIETVSRSILLVADLSVRLRFLHSI